MHLNLYIYIVLSISMCCFVMLYSTRTDVLFFLHETSCPCRHGFTGLPIAAIKRELANTKTCWLTTAVMQPANIDNRTM